MKLAVFLLLLGLVISAVLAKPMPQEKSKTNTNEASDETKTEKEDLEAGSEIKDEDDDDEEEEKDKPLKAIGEAFEGFLALLGGVAKAAERVATDPEVHSTVGEIVEASIQGTMEAVEAAAGLVKDVPKIIEEQRPFVEGLALTIGETSGFVGGVIQERVSDVMDDLREISADARRRKKKEEAKEKRRKKEKEEEEKEEGDQILLGTRVKLDSE